MANDLISIIIPVYNVEPYLQRCLHSVVSQTYQNLEIILVDDGSMDRSGRICDEWALRDDRLTVIHKENGGLSSARNAGIDIASGRYIGFVDSDDYIEPTMYEVLLRAIEDNGAQIACCGRNRIEGHCVTAQHSNDALRLMSGEEAIQQLLIGGLVEEAAWDKLYWSELFEGRRYPVGEVNEDIVLTISLLGECSAVVHVGVPLYNYCQNSGSITNSALSPAKFVMLDHLDQIKKYLERHYPILLDDYCLLEERYTRELLYLLLANAANKRKYSEEYGVVINRFRNAWCKAVLTDLKRINVKGFLLYLGLYYSIHQIIVKMKG